MHYSLGQKVWDGHVIVEFEKVDSGIVVWVEKQGELKPWKEFNKYMAICVENDLDFGSDEKERAE